MRRRDLHALTQQLICTTENFPEVFDATAASQSDVKLLRYEIERLQARVAELERKVEAVRALHHQRTVEALDGYIVTFDDCACCDQTWPCPTIRALDGEEADRGDR